MVAKKKASKKPIKKAAKKKSVARKSSKKVSSIPPARLVPSNGSGVVADISEPSGPTAA